MWLVAPTRSDKHTVYIRYIRMISCASVMATFSHNAHVSTPRKYKHCGSIVFQFHGMYIFS